MPGVDGGHVADGARPVAGEFAHLQLEVVHNAVDAGTPVLKGSRHGLHDRHPRIARGFGLQEAPFPLGFAVGEALFDEAILLRGIASEFHRGWTWTQNSWCPTSAASEYRGGGVGDPGLVSLIPGVRVALDPERGREFRQGRRGRAGRGQLGLIEFVTSDTS